MSNCKLLSTISELSERDYETIKMLVCFTLLSDDPCITISRGRELLGYTTMNEMQELLKTYQTTWKKEN